MKIENKYIFPALMVLFSLLFISYIHNLIPFFQIQTSLHFRKIIQLKIFVSDLPTIYIAITEQVTSSAAWWWLPFATGFSLRVSPPWTHYTRSRKSKWPKVFVKCQVRWAIITAIPTFSTTKMCLKA